MRVLILGLGGVGQRHLRNLKALRPKAEIIAVRHTGRRFVIGPDLTADPTRDVEAEFSITRCTTVAEAATLGLDCAIIASPSSAHLAQTLELVRLGVPVFLEKPVSHSGEGLDGLLTEAAARAVPVVVAYMLRWHPAVIQLRRWLAEGVLGRLHSVQALAHSYLPAWHSYEPYNGFYAGRKALGGGVVLTEIHIVDLLFALFGLPRRLWSVGGTLSELDLDVEDTVATLMEYQRDGRPLPVSLTTSFVQRSGRMELALHGERGGIRLSLPENSVSFDNVEAGTRAVVGVPEGFERNDLFVAELADFLDCLETGRTSETDLARVVDGHRMALAIHASLAGGGPVMLPPPG